MFGGLCTCLSAIGAIAAEREIYFTDFEDAPVGDGELIGYDNWVGSSVSGGWHGIDEEAVQGLGQSAFVGFNPPGGFGTSSVFAGRLISHDPVTTGERYLRLTAVIGISDTSGGAARNLFYIDFANSSLERLASLNYNNTETAFGLWRDDGVDIFDTGEEFIRDELQLLFIDIDLVGNTWSVELGGFPVFRDQPFTAKPAARDLGAVFFTWQRGGIFPWGNNWMFIDDFSVTVDSVATVIPEEPFKLISVGRDGSNDVVLTWRAQPGFDYQVEYSDDMATWRTDLPDSLKSEPVEVETSYTDLSASSAPNRIYRVVRTESGS